MGSRPHFTPLAANANAVIPAAPVRSPHRVTRAEPPGIAFLFRAGRQGSDFSKHARMESIAGFDSGSTSKRRNDFARETRSTSRAKNSFLFNAIPTCGFLFASSQSGLRLVGRRCACQHRRPNPSADLSTCPAWERRRTPARPLSYLGYRSRFRSLRRRSASGSPS